MVDLVSLDLGTTAVKLGRVRAGSVVATAASATNAYAEEQLAGVFIKEQHVSCILKAVEYSATKLYLHSAALRRPSAGRIAIADAMHGVILWTSQGGMDGHPSLLITWEDRRCPESLLGAVNASLLRRGSTSLVHHGYGMATLAALVLDELTGTDANAHSSRVLSGRPLASFDRCGTIGSYVAAQLIDTTAGAPAVVDPTDAASWGAYDAARCCFLVDAVASAVAELARNALRAAAAAVRAADALVPTVAELQRRAVETFERLLPAVAPSGAFLGRLSASRCAALGVPAFAEACGLTAGAGEAAVGSDGSELRASVAPSVHVPMGDHPASVLGALAALQRLSAGDAHAADSGDSSAASPLGGAGSSAELKNGSRGRGSDTGSSSGDSKERIVFLNAGTSFQAACVLPRHEADSMAAAAVTAASAGGGGAPSAAASASFEIRPLPPDPAEATAGAEAGERCLIIAASMNGGNVLASLAARYCDAAARAASTATAVAVGAVAVGASTATASGSPASPASDASPALDALIGSAPALAAAFTLEHAYRELEEAALPLLADASNITWPWTDWSSAAASRGSTAASTAGAATIAIADLACWPSVCGVASDARIAPERRAIIAPASAHAGTGGAEVGSAASAAPSSGAEAAGAALAPAAAASAAMPVAGAHYAAAALAIMHNALSMLPPGLLWADASDADVSAGGGAGSGGGAATAPSSPSDAAPTSQVYMPLPLKLRFVLTGSAFSKSKALAAAARLYIAARSTLRCTAPGCMHDRGSAAAGDACSSFDAGSTPASSAAELPLPRTAASIVHLPDEVTASCGAIGAAFVAAAAAVPD